MIICNHSQPFCCKDDVCHSGWWHLRLKIASAQCIYCRRTKERVFRCDEGETERQIAIQRTRERGGREIQRESGGGREIQRERYNESERERDTTRERYERE